MKKIIILLVFLTLMAACKEKNHQIELLENNELIYLPLSELERQPKLLNKISDISNEIKEIFLSKVENIESKKFPIMFYYEYFVDKKGKIEKLMRATLINKRGEIIQKKEFGMNLPENFSEDIEPVIIKTLEKVKFSFDIDSLANEFKGNLTISLLKDNKNDIQTDVSFGLQDFTDSPIIVSSDGNNSDVFFVVVESPPEPIGGMDAIMKQVKYPEIAKRAGIQGRVYIKAFLDEEGNVVGTEIIKSADKILDSAAVNAIMRTKFKPGMQKGKPVKTQVAIPIVFKLK